MTLKTDVYFSQMNVTLECEVEYTPYAEERETWGKYGGTPYEPAHCDVESVIHCGVDFSEFLTEGETDDLADKCEEDVNEQAWDAILDRREEAL